MNRFPLVHIQIILFNTILILLIAHVLISKNAIKNELSDCNVINNNWSISYGDNKYLYDELPDFVYTNGNNTVTLQKNLLLHNHTNT